MSRHRLTLVIDVDDELLADHVQNAERRGGPYTAAGGDWDASDVFAMVEHGIVDPHASEYTYEGTVAP